MDNTDIVSGKYVVGLLRSVLNGTSPDLCENDVDWDKLKEIAASHHVTNMVYYAIEKFSVAVPCEILDYFSQEHMKSLLRDAQQQADIELILSEFSNNSIRSLPLKGYIMKEYYPSPDMRYMSDLDVLVDLENLQKAHEVLENLGYTFSFEGKDTDNFEKKPVMYIEVHKHLMDEDMETIADYYNSSSGFLRAKPLENDAYAYRLSDEEFYLYMIAHLAKH